MDKEKIYYVYYSYEQFGKGYIGYRKCPECLTPETDNYFGSFTDKSFKPTEKIILFQDLTKEEAIEIEIKLHNFYDIDKNPHFANKAKQTSIGFSYDTTSSKWYNNGVKQELFSPDEEIPEGFILGRLEETKQKQSEAKKGENNPNFGKIYYNNGIEQKCFSPDEEIPEGYIIGGLPHSKETKRKQSEVKKGENNPNFGKIKINNGIKEIYISPDKEIPKGFILGILEETKQKQSEAQKGENNPIFGKKCYNNGIENKYFSPEEEIPEGYFLGVKVETTQKCSEARKSINYKQKIRVITSSCCYFSVKEAIKELGISHNKFKNLFEKDPITGFYVEKEKY